jgi:hypothetical protein
MVHELAPTGSTTSGVSASSPSTPPAAVKLRQKRAQVVRACGACRLHRTKCDNNPICQSCRSRGTPCSSSDASKLGTLSHAQKEIDRLKMQIQKLQQELQLAQNKTAPSHERQLLTPTNSPFDPRQVGSNDQSVTRGTQKGSWEGIHVVTARSQYETWYGPSSLFYFIKRVTTVLSDSLQQNLSVATVLPIGASKLLHGPTSLAEDIPESRVTQSTDDASKTAVYLSATQEEYFISLFWQAYNTSLFPILDEAEFTEHYRSLWTTSATTRKQSALVDIVIAMCMQYGISMLPAAKQGVFVDNNDATIAGRWHYRRCQMLLAYEVESPKITTLQCHLLCCVYLCCGTFQNMADSACGLAVRTAYMLGLHLEPPQTMPMREREMRKRLWWILYTLDSKIGMKLGRPFILHDSLATPSLPSDAVEVAAVSGSNFALLGENVTWLSFNLQQVKLFQIAKAAYMAFFEQDLHLDHGQTAWDNPETMDTMAELMSPYTQRFNEWVIDVPAVLKTKRQDGGSTFSTDTTALDIEQFAPVWIQRQRLILELVYHNLSLNCYRPFIAFSTSSPSTNVAKEGAIRCSAHAVALTHIIHQVLSSSSILDGWHEAFQWQWNAAMTLVGFRLAYPQDVSIVAVRNAIHLSIAVFDVFGRSFSIAANAADIIRDLNTKIDFLTEQSCTIQNELAETIISTGDSSFSAASTAMDAFSEGFDFNSFIAKQQDIFDMAMSIDLWNDTGSLWPDTGGSLPNMDQWQNNVIC